MVEHSKPEETSPGAADSSVYAARVQCSLVFHSRSCSVSKRASTGVTSTRIVFGNRLVVMRLSCLQVPEPTSDEAYQILLGLRERYEAHHKLRYSDESLRAAADYSSQYISDRFLPDKAIDLIDEAGSRVRLRHAALPEEAREVEKELRQVQKEKDESVRAQEFEKAGDLRDKETELKAKIDAIIKDKSEEDKAESATSGTGPVVEEADIANIVSTWTGIPVEKVSSDETERLVNMESVLHDRVVGQEEAVVAISRAIRRARVGLKNPARPIASFIFSGPTGVGKSELAKTLATYYFGSEEAMVRPCAPLLED